MRTAKQPQNPVQLVYREHETPADRAAQAQAWRLLVAACCPKRGTADPVIIAPRINRTPSVR
ncbi:MAG: hypothetical protein WC718_16880 [Phycisphaerales bacterium]|jgi:hypothetical protein